MSLGKSFLDRFTLPGLFGEEEIGPEMVFLGDGVEVDLREVRVLHRGIDTVRQLYEGLLKEDVLEVLEKAMEDGPNSIIQLGGHDWVVQGGGRARYKYLLRNLEFGATVLVKSHFRKEDQKGSHVKIQLSPQLLNGRSHSEIQGILDGIAGCVLDGPQCFGCAIHLCVDLQGWQPADDFERRLVTRSRQQDLHNGLSEMYLEGADVIQIYGKRETFMFGRASGIQYSCYRKDLAAKHFKNEEYWRQVWSAAHDDDGCVYYDDQQPVWRHEFRFHHQPVKEMGYGIKKNLKRFFDVANHLDAIFDYGLGAFRLDLDDRYVDPLWQFFYEDVNFGTKSIGVKIVRAKPDPLCSLTRNIDYAVGNLLSIFAARNLSLMAVTKYMIGAGIWVDFCEVQNMRGNDPQQWLEKNLALRRLKKGVA